MNVSVVIPAHNEDDNLPVAIASIRNQSVPPYEIVVVDHASTDNTYKVANELADRVIRAPADVRVGEVRNIGINAANGDIIYCTDADVIFERNIIERTIERFEEDPDLNALSHLIRAPTEDGFVERFVTGLSNLTTKSGWGASMAFKKEVWEDIGGFENIGGRSYTMEPEDITFWKAVPEPKLLDRSAIVRAEVSEWKCGFIPVAATSLAVSSYGAYKYNERHGKLLAWGGAGAMTGEIGHHLVDNDRLQEKLPPLPHHDTLALAGLAGVYLYDRYGKRKIDNKYKYPAYGFLSGIFLQHLFTEGLTGICHNERRSVLDSNETRPSLSVT